MIDFFDIFAFFVFAVLLCAVVIIVVTIGSLPGMIAARRGHPYAVAVQAAGWISLVTLGALWPLAFVWAFVDLPTRPPTGKGGAQA